MPILTSRRRQARRVASMARAIRVAFDRLGNANLTLYVIGV